MKRQTISKILALVAMMLCMMVFFTSCGDANVTGGSSTTASSTTKAISGNTSSPSNPVKISIDEWIGWQSLLDANGGLVTTPDSLNAQKGVYVEYIPMNDATASSNALISGNLAGAGYTVNRYAFLQARFDEAGVKVVMPFITNFSNGGDGIIAKSEIRSINDLVGKKIAVPRYSEAQTLVEWLLNTSSLSDAEKTQIRNNMIYFETADDTAKAFFSGSVDAAATWEPYLTQAASSTDSGILFDTSMSTNLILDGLVFRADFAEENGEFITNLIDAALEAAPMYKKEFSNIRALPMFELMTDAEIIDMANGADLATWGQNSKLLTDTAIVMYRDMANVWITIGEEAHPEKAESAFTDKYMQNLSDKYKNQESASASGFNPADKIMVIESPDALLEYSVDIKFALNSFEIMEVSYPELNDFIQVAKVLDGVYIQIEGNASKRADGVTDAQIIEFSTKRAEAIANYFISQGISEERILVIGNGDMNPQNAENPAAPENRRTEIFFKTKMGY